MTVLLYGFLYVGVLLQVVLIFLLLRSSLRQYKVFFAYCVIQLALIVSQNVAFYSAGQHSELYRNVYWWSEVIAYFLLFIMVILMTDRVLQGSPLRQKATKILFIITVVGTLLPFVLFQNYFTTRWFRETCQLLSLSGAVMNLVLWTGDRKSTRLNSSHIPLSRMPSSA